MKFSVPPFQYVVSLEFPLFDAEGKPVAGLVDYDQHRIRLDARVAPKRLEHNLRHELAHAWHYETSADDMGEESRAQMMATQGQMFDREFREQGGRDALATLAIRATIHADPQEEIVACRHCGAWHVAARDVRMEPAEPEPDQPDVPVCRRSLTCRQCRKESAWIESCHDGQPTAWEMRRIA